MHTLTFGYAWDACDAVVLAKLAHWQVDETTSKAYACYRSQCVLPWFAPYHALFELQH